MLKEKELSNTQKELRKLVKQCKSSRFTVEKMPKRCMEYLSTGEGDTDCGGKIVNGKCQACGTKYVIK